jgi:DNA-directed RNA polymerase specialized sigma24 family protein
MATLDRPEVREPLNQLLLKVRPALERVLRHYDIPPEDAEDLLQDSQLTLLYKWDKIQSLCEAVDAAILEMLSKPQTPVQVRRELAHDLQRVIVRLPARCQSLLKLRYGLGYGPTEVAIKMGYQPSSIRKVTNRCLAALTRELVAIGFWDDVGGEPDEG